MLNNLIYVLPLFVTDAKEVALARTTQLRTPTYVGTVQVDIAAWEELEAKKYDRFQTLQRCVIMYEGTCHHRCVGDPDVGSEKELLAWVWGVLDSVNAFTTPAGWNITKWWGTLINRSIRVSCEIPRWAVPSRSQKYLKLPLHDFCNLYQAGNGSYEKPTPDVGYALQGWLGRNFNTIEAIQQLSTIDSTDVKIHADMCAIVKGLEEVEHRLCGVTYVNK